MTTTAPRSMAKGIALVASVAIVAVAGMAVWMHFSGRGGDDPARRDAVIRTVLAPLNTAAANSSTCIQQFTQIAEQSGQQGQDALAPLLDKTATCGQSARVIAEQGYSALDNVSIEDDSDQRAAFLDAAGSLLSVYEMQGDDFDAVQDMLRDNAVTDAPLSISGKAIEDVLSGSAPDIASGREQLDNAMTAYRHQG